MPDEPSRREVVDTEESGDDKERHFVQAQESFGVSLLWQARQMVRGLPPAAQGEHPDTPLAEAASEALDRLIEHVVALPEDKQSEALTVIAYGMIMEYLRVSGTTPRAQQSS